MDLVRKQDFAWVVLGWEGHRDIQNFVKESRIEIEGPFSRIRRILAR